MKTEALAPGLDLTFDVPLGFFRGSAVTIVRLETPDAASPRVLGTPSDQRRLGVAVGTLRLRSAAQ